jgi:DNA-binding GntR family transcriptional regulator
VHIKNKKNAVLNLREPVGPQVYQILHNQIIQGNVAPGTRFSEAEISKEFETSRQPVREAFI